MFNFCCKMELCIRIKLNTYDISMDIINVSLGKMQKYKMKENESCCETAITDGKLYDFDGESDK